MNQRILELTEQAGSTHKQSLGVYQFYTHELQKFAELIVQECIDKMLNSDDAHFMELEGWDLGGPNHNAWVRGVLDSVGVVREHFGVEIEE